MTCELLYDNEYSGGALSSHTMVLDAIEMLREATRRHGIHLS